MSPKTSKSFGDAPAHECSVPTSESRPVMSVNFNNPSEVSKAGEAIYERLYKSEYEQKHPGKYAAINLADESVTLGDTASAALAEAKRLHPRGFFHIIRVGYQGAFEVGLAYRSPGSSATKAS